MQCQKCGTEVESGVNFCSACGAAASAERHGGRIALAVIAFTVVLVGMWVYLGTPIPTALVGLDLPFMGRQAVVIHDTTLYPGTDIQAVVGALVQNQLFGDVGGLCDQGITCEGRQIIKAGTHVRVVKEITMQNDRLHAKFAQVQIGATEGWVAANAIQ